MFRWSSGINTNGGYKKENINKIAIKIMIIHLHKVKHPNKL